MAEHIQNPQIFTNAGELSGKCANPQPDMHINILRDRIAELEAALNRIGSGSFQGASMLAVRGEWKEFGNQLQIIARQALAQSAELAKP